MEKASSTVCAMTVITICAVLLVGVLLRREFFGDAEVGIAPGAPEYVEGWEDMLGEKLTVASSAGTAQVFAFLGFKCPYCPDFHENTLWALEEEFGDALKVTFLHLPLDIHPFADAAAIAAGCTAEQGQFRQFADASFAMQDSIGVQDWIALANDAGIPDVTIHTECMHLVPDALT